jgi:xanthine dehydrogenase YagS FAD-binding subunit
MATALSALAAVLKIAGQDREREVPLDAFYTPLGNTLRSNEFITEIQIPAVRPETRQRFLKFAVRKTIDFAISSVAAVITVAADKVVNARIVCGGIAPTPHRAIEAEEILKGRILTDRLAASAAKSALTKAKPLSKNAYKLPITRTILKRAILE